MTEKHILQAQPRQLMGKKVKQLRNAKKMVANVSIPGGESAAIQIDQRNFNLLFDKVGESSLIYLKIEGEAEERPVLVDEVQENPVTEEIVHVSFRQVSLKDKVTAEVPLEIIGEVDIPESVMVTVRDSVEVEALPTDLPEKIEVDVTVLTEIGQSISLADLAIDEAKVSLVLGEDQDPQQMPIVLIQEQKEEEVEEETPEVEGEEGEAEAVEGETKEGEDKSGKEADSKDKKEDADDKSGGEAKKED